MSVPTVKVELLLCCDDTSIVALSIPLAQCETFANSPLKWLRFLGFIIYGRQGHLSTSEYGPELDYTVQIEARPYYFISDGEPRFADVGAIDNRTSDASELSSERADFRQKLIMRDESCIFTGDFANNCDACHILPHSKGDDYMSTLFSRQHEAYGLVDPLNNINDTQNGILLSVLFRHVLDVGDIAFLMTPNFALSTDDIPYHQPPNGGSPATRFTLQHIQPSQMGPLVPFCAPHNSDARQPQDISQWPLAIIADLSYAAAVLRAWGQKSFTEYVQANSNDSYYGGSMEGNINEDAPGNQTTQVSHWPIDQTTCRGPRTAERYHRWSVSKAQACTPADQPTREDMFDGILAMWSQAAREAASERRPPGSNAADASDSNKKVQTWLQSIEE